MANALDVAQFILEKHGEMTTMKLQKLCYYSQGWSLAWDEVPIFDNQIEAWANGPVVRDLYRTHRGQFRISKIQGGDSNALSEAEQDTVNAVLSAYGHLTGQQLSDLSHNEDPWINARGDAPEGSTLSTPIDRDALQDFFGGLDSAQRAS
ncbi:Panacea domain-containing protein [Nesterenkonia lutea]|uniref:Phage-associated protein n=1 Tax=Nesterenkonia lutea TaxID=272919 RepID=A0ABR9JBC3_9MICC|nr:type II toxin-antitoxin system antitoxin SocA domain-containing protein [Nesterenkonia lutea]MBE1523236.1 putative phage-associated protein [Nesterenkonia lutea]